MRLSRRTFPDLRIKQCMKVNYIEHSSTLVNSSGNDYTFERYVILFYKNLTKLSAQLEPWCIVTDHCSHVLYNFVTVVRFKYSYSAIFGTNYCSHSILKHVTSVVCDSFTVNKAKVEPKLAKAQSSFVE